MILATTAALSVSDRFRNTCSESKYWEVIDDVFELSAILGFCPVTKEISIAVSIV